MKPVSELAKLAGGEPFAFAVRYFYPESDDTPAHWGVWNFHEIEPSIRPSNLFYANTEVKKLYSAPPTTSAAVAAVEAREMKLREALECAIKHDYQGYYKGQHHQILGNATLALPHDTTALREMMREAASKGLDNEQGFGSAKERDALVDTIVNEVLGRTE